MEQAPHIAATLTEPESRSAPIVCLPGLLETHHIWHALTVRLGIRARQMMLCDLPGHQPGEDAGGVSRAMSGEDWLRRLADRIRRRFDGVPVTLVGHSTGGLLAIRLARHHPDVVQSLVLIGALIRGDRGRRFDPGARLAAAPLVGPVAFRASLRLWLSSRTSFQRGYALAAADRQLRIPAPDAMRRQLLACDPMGLHATAMGVLQADVQVELADVACPVLAVIGTRDPVVPALHQLDILRKAPRAVAQLLPCGHLPFAECPERLVRTLLAWQSQPRSEVLRDISPRVSVDPDRSPVRNCPARYDRAAPGSVPK